MNVCVYKEHGALNSKPVFEAFEQGVLTSGDHLVSSYEEADCVVIWSVLFQGRMAKNKEVWERAQKDNKPVIVLEVGTLKRNESWRVGINGINRDAEFNETIDLQPDRYKLLGIDLKPWQDDSKEFITIATQRPDSLQWLGRPSVESWLDTMITAVRQHSSRPIVIRPHPRDRITNWQSVAKHNVFFDLPKPIGNYDSVNFPDILNRTHMLINYCTSPAIEAVINGVPVIVGSPSMCWDISSAVENIETPYKPDRTVWRNRLAHTEWFVDEIEKGIPWQRLRNLI